MSEVGNDVPGAGVDPTKVIRPAKRLKKLWVANGRPGSLKAWVRSHADDKNFLAEYAEQWFHHKSAAFTAEARKERKARVRAGQAIARSTKSVDRSGKKGKGKDKDKRKGKGKGKAQDSE